MLTLLKNIEVFSPDYLGKKDILIAGDKIERVMPVDSFAGIETYGEIIDCSEYLCFPGIIDQHIHITGGGGEDGFASKLPELSIDEITSAGVTTAVGLLGADGITRNPEGLYSKAKALENQGITTFIYSGSYTLPCVTFTGSVAKDIVLIDKVIGAGEIAISDHRSSPFPMDVLIKLAADVHLGGLLSGKAGILHLHVGDGKSKLSLLLQLIEESDLPVEEFVPTHVNRNPYLFDQAVCYCKNGGHIDLTAGETAGISVPEAVKDLIGRGAELSRVTISSDAGGSFPGGGIAKAKSLYDDIIGCVNSGIAVDDAFRLATENVAKTLKLYPRKGAIKDGSDADILITDKNLKMVSLFGMGKLLIKESNFKSLNGEK